MTQTDQTDTAPVPPWRARTAILALGAFVVGTDGFIIVGLLPEISHTLDVSTGAAGQLVSLFSLAYAFSGPVLAALTGRWPRRRVLVVGVALLAVGNAVTASAHTYALVLASRVLAGAGAAMFMASAVATAAYLAGDKHRGRAITMVTAGATLALVLGAPLGTFIGGAWGWQAAIWFVAAIAAVVAVVVAVLLPSVRLDQSTDLRERLAPLTDRRVLRILVVTLFAFIGIFLPFTYMSAVFAPALDGSQDKLALLLMVFGVAATAGNLGAGALADRTDPRRVVIGATAGMVAVFLLMLAVRDDFVLAAVTTALSGVVSYAVMGPQQHRVITYSPAGGASLVTSLNTSAAYLGNFAASLIGAAVLARSAALLLPVAAAFAAAACLLVWLLSRPGKAFAAPGAPLPRDAERPAGREGGPQENRSTTS
ncbi:MFS transporter [Streptomyces tremellae]|uniref:MFS transporter n=1 Tax=Streptomyces tremellae TaxID=1124239 RepID=A0ABP7EJ78_9ACTN